MRPTLRYDGSATDRARNVARRAGTHLLAETLRPLRWRARRRVDRLERGGVTVVTVNWNALDLLGVAVTQVRRHSRRPVKMLVVDNHSEVDPRPHLKALGPWIRAVRLPMNVGHGLALDLGVLLADTEFVVTLDVDAYPIDSRWLDVLLDPLGEGTAVVGCESGRSFAHPCGLGMRTARFVEEQHSFVARFTGGPDGWDVGERISQREQPRVGLIPRTDSLGAGMIGSVFGEVIYHNAYGTRHLRENDPESARLDLGASRADAMAAWREALDRFGAGPSAFGP